ncbi:MAG: hypothetical protein WCH01_10725 [Methylococcaceae bacterium]
MKKNKLAIELSLTILIAVGMGNVAYAKSASTSPSNTKSVVDPIQTNNTQYKGLKSPNSSRKEAAKRLKVDHQQEHQQKLQNWTNTHHGFTGRGKAGNSFGSHQIPVNQGGEK